MQTYKQCSIKLEIGVNGVISQPAILGSIQSEALIQFFKQSEKSVSRKLTIKLELNNHQNVVIIWINKDARFAIAKYIVYAYTYFRQKTRIRPEPLKKKPYSALSSPVSASCSP